MYPRIRTISSGRGNRVIDFDAAWRHLQQTTKAPDDCQRWNKKAARYDSRDAKNLYAEAFVELAGVQPGETIFDMGCGTGTLAAEMATRGHKVIVGDFSSGMLAKLRENMALRDIKVAESLDALTPGSVFPLRMSWEDDWSQFGLRENMADVAFASRSIAVADLRSALRKLSSIARRRCCITMTTGTSPRVDARVLAELGVGAELNRDYIYAFGMLAQAGFEPEVRYIHSSRKDSFESKDDAFGDFSQMIDIGAPALSEVERLQAQANLREWLAEHLVDNPEAGMPDKKGYPQGPLTLDYQRVVPWAFISWNAKDGQL